MNSASVRHAYGGLACAKKDIGKDLIGASGSSESRHFDQISTVIMIRKRIVKAVLDFLGEALIYKAFSCFWI